MKQINHFFVPSTNGHNGKRSVRPHQDPETPSELPTSGPEPQALGPVLTVSPDARSWIRVEPLGALLATASKAVPHQAYNR